jgi:hypothetical protein
MREKLRMGPGPRYAGSELLRIRVRTGTDGRAGIVGEWRVETIEVERELELAIDEMLSLLCVHGLVRAAAISRESAGP